MVVKSVRKVRETMVGRIHGNGKFWAWSEREKEWWMHESTTDQLTTHQEPFIGRLFVIRISEIWVNIVQLTDASWAFFSVSRVTDTDVTTSVVLTSGVRWTVAAMYRTLVYVCTVKHLLIYCVVCTFYVIYFMIMQTRINRVNCMHWSLPTARNL